MSWGKTARLYVNGEDAGEVEDLSLTFDAGPTTVVDTGVFSAGPVTTSVSGTMEMRGKAARELRAFIRHVGRWSTPYAKGRGLRKPRGRKGKALRRYMWRRDLERRLMATSLDADRRALGEALTRAAQKGWPSCP